MHVPELNEKHSDQEFVVDEFLGVATSGKTLENSQWPRVVPNEEQEQFEVLRKRPAASERTD